MINISKNLNLLPGGVPVIVNVSQYDKGQTLNFAIYDQGTLFTIPTGAEVSIQGTKPDGHGFAYSCTFSGSTVTATLQQQMTAVAGDVLTEIAISKSGNLIATANFILRVEKAALGDDTVISDTEIPEIIALATQQVEDAEAWANGTRNGVPVGSSDPAYHNNSYYWSQQPKAASQITYDNTQSGLPSTNVQGAVDDLKQTLSNVEGENVSDNEAYILRQGKGNMVDLELVGGSLAWNQLIKNGNFADTNNWETVGSTFTVSNNVGTITPTAQWGRIQTEDYSILANHVYLAFATVKGTTDNYLSIGNLGSIYCSGTTEQTLFKMIKPLSASSEKVAVGDRRSSGWTAFTVKNVMFIDLTQDFGSTIADYIYSLEQATAGAGVAWFRKYFPNAYYAYNAGSIQSVNPSNRKVIGKNLVELFFQTKTINGITFVNNGDGTFTLDGTATAATNIRLDQKADGTVVNPKAYLAGTYAMSKNSTKFGLIIMQESTFISVASLTTPDLTGIRTIPNYIDNCFVYIAIYSGASFNNETFKVQIERGDKVTAFEPYKEYTFPFANKQLRGIFYLDANNKLCADGDIWKANEGITRRYGIVTPTAFQIKNGSTLNNMFLFDSTLIPNAKKPSDNTGKANLICNRFDCSYSYDYAYSHGNVIGASMNSSGNLTIAFGGSSGIDTLEEANAWLASNPITFVYELATPTTESANPYQNPQSAFSDGIEEFVYDSGIAVPVGNNSVYQTSEILPLVTEYAEGVKTSVIDTIKAVVADSSDFADFQTKMAAL